MRMEIDKKYSETERLKNKYEAKYSNLHTFDDILGVILCICFFIVDCFI